MSVKHFLLIAFLGITPLLLSCGSDEPTGKKLTLNYTVSGKIEFEYGTFLHGERGTAPGLDVQYEAYLPYYNKVVEACTPVEWEVKYTNATVWKDLEKEEVRASNWISTKKSALDAIQMQFNNMPALVRNQFDFHMTIVLKETVTGEMPESKYALKILSPTTIYLRYEGIPK